MVRGKEGDTMNLQDRIKARRLELGMTLADVAYKMGVAESTVSRYESSHIQDIKIDKFKRLADVLKTTPAELLGWNEKEATPDVVYNDILIELEKASPVVKQQVLSYISFLNRDKDED